MDSSHPIAESANQEQPSSSSLLISTPQKHSEQHAPGRPLAALRSPGDEFIDIDDGQIPMSPPPPIIIDPDPVEEEEHQQSHLPGAIPSPSNAPPTPPATPLSAAESILSPMPEKFVMHLDVSQSGKKQLVVEGTSPSNAQQQEQQEQQSKEPIIIEKQQDMEQKQAQRLRVASPTRDRRLSLDDRSRSPPPRGASSSNGSSPIDNRSRIDAVQSMESRRSNSIHEIRPASLLEKKEEEQPKYVPKKINRVDEWLPESLDPSGQPLRVLIATWNLAGRDAPSDLSPLMRPQCHHIYAIGTEECERSIEASLLIRSKAKWEQQISDWLGGPSHYTLLRSQTLMATHLVVFVRNDLVPLISGVQSASVSTGLLSGAIGNKGGVAIAFRVGSTPMLFINSHFAAHQTAIAERNSDYERINSELALFLKPDLEAAEAPPIEADDQRLAQARSTLASAPKSAVSKLSVCDRFPVVFWGGDFNYRINGTRRMVDHLLKTDLVEVLLANDQLMIEKKKGTVFRGLHEAEVSFRPTYKFDAGTDLYDTSAKQRVPAWTDRILYKPSAAVELLHYDSVPNIRTSDHRPVVAKFNVTFSAKDNADGSGSDGQKSAACTIL